MNRILVTGGFGYIGSVLVNTLLDKGYALSIMDNRVYERNEWQQPLRSGQLRIVTGDLLNPAAIEKSLSDAEAVIHLAGISDGRAGRIDPQKTMEVNAGAFELLVRMSKLAGIKRFLFASTFGVYGNNYTQLLTEDLPVNPPEPYSESKALCEQILQENRSNSFHGISLRLAMVYGYSPTMRFDFIVNNLVWKALTEHTIHLMGGAQKRPQIHVKDAAEYFMLLLEMPKEKMKAAVYNAGNENISLGELAKLIANTLKNPVNIVTKPERPNENTFELDSGKIAAQLGLYPSYSIRDAILEIEEKFNAGYWKLSDAV